MYFSTRATYVNNLRYLLICVIPLADSSCWLGTIVDLSREEHK